MPYLIALAMLLLLGCDRPENVQRSADDPFLTTPTHVSYNIRVRFADSSRIKAVMEAGTAYVNEQSKQTTFGQSIVVNFYSVESGKRVAILTADSSSVDDATNNLTAIGDVKVYSDSTRTTLTTDRLLWENNTELLKSQDYVKIVSPTEVIEGIGFVSDRFLTQYRIFRVKGQQAQ